MSCLRHTVDLESQRKIDYNSILHNKVKGEAHCLRKITCWWQRGSDVSWDKESQDTLVILHFILIHFYTKFHLKRTRFMAWKWGNSRVVFVMNGMRDRSVIVVVVVVRDTMIKHHPLTVRRQRHPYVVLMYSIFSASF